MQTQANKSELKEVIRRRKGIFFITFFSIFILALVIAVFLPSVYKSQARILIENQEISEDYVKSTINTIVNERMHVIRQQIESRSVLLRIIDDFDLYRDIDSTEDKLEIMRESIKLEPVEAGIVDERTGRDAKVTIALKLSYEGSDPVTVKEVATTLADQFVQEDVRTREKSAGNTADFIQKELDVLKKEILRSEDKISKFKTANIDVLPGSSGANLQAVGRLESDLDKIDTRLRTLREKKIYLEAQIATVDPLLPVVTDEGKMSSNPQERLKSLRLELTRKQAVLSDQHPDIKALKSEIAKLESQVGNVDDTDAKVKRLIYVNEQLAKSKGTLGENHPDVIKLSRERDALSAEIGRMQTARTMKNYAAEKPDNPAYINLKAQIVATNAEIQALLDEKETIKDKLADYRFKIERAPLVEEEYNALTLDYESAKQKYNEVLNKLMSAKIAGEMDVSGRGERFSIAEFPSVPEKPYKPNRLAIILLGFIIGIGAGFTMGAIKENIDNTVKSTDEIKELIKAPVFASISYYETAQKRRTRLIKNFALATAVAGIIVCGSIAVHLYVVPLNDVWYKFETRLAEMGIIEENVQTN